MVKGKLPTRKALIFIQRLILKVLKHLSSPQTNHNTSLRCLAPGGQAPGGQVQKGQVSAEEEMRLPYGFFRQVDSEGESQPSCQQVGLPKSRMGKDASSRF